MKKQRKANGNANGTYVWHTCQNVDQICQNFDNFANFDKFVEIETNLFKIWQIYQHFDKSVTILTNLSKSTQIYEHFDKFDKF